MNRICCFLLACLLQACLGSVVYAQAQNPFVDPEEARSSARFHLGPIRFTPAFTFAGPGVDTNVFNEFDEPRQDWTARANPKSDWWLRMGRGELSASTGLEYVYFAKYDTERALNTDDSARLAVTLGRLTPFVTGGYLNARMRPSFEIDARARRAEERLGAGADVRVLDKTTLSASVGRSRVRFDAADRFLGTSLSGALDRTTESWQGELRQQVLSLTSVVLRAEGAKDRFATSVFRNADSFALMPGVQFKPRALIKGSAFVGYRTFETVSPDVPDFKGLVAALDLAYTVSSTRVAVHVSRDVAYSFEPTQPFYVLLDSGVRLTKMMTRSWDVDALVSWQRMAYQQGTVDTALPRDDYGFNASTGVGRWVGRTLRIGFDLNYFRRRTGLAGRRDYRSTQAGLSVKYGLKP